ncbi:MAG: transposase [Erysipelothrix sp.]|nr:transposase [Erysipelothrix sp.]
MDEFKSELEQASYKLLPKSKLGEAAKHNLTQFVSFEQVLLDGRLELTNNRVGSEIKSFIIGRKNWLFMNTTFKYAFNPTFPLCGMWKL